MRIPSGTVQSLGQGVAPFLWNARIRWAGPNDGVRRGDREDTGDNEAQPDELASGPAQPTIDPTSLGGTSSIDQPSSSRNFDIEQERTDYDGMEVMEANDGRLGLTGVAGSEAEDWAADTGRTRSAEEL